MVEKKTNKIIKQIFIKNCDKKQIAKEISNEYQKTNEKNIVTNWDF